MRRGQTGVRQARRPGRGTGDISLQAANSLKKSHGVGHSITVGPPEPAVVSLDTVILTPHTDDYVAA